MVEVFGYAISTVLFALAATAYYFLREYRLMVFATGALLVTTSALLSSLKRVRKWTM